MAAKNFGQINGPFQANQNILLKIKQQEDKDIDFLIKLGVHYIGNFDLDILGKYVPEQHVLINNIDFQIGKTRMLELQDCQITSIAFENNKNDRWFIDYEY